MIRYFYGANGFPHYRFLQFSETESDPLYRSVELLRFAERWGIPGMKQQALEVIAEISEDMARPNRKTLGNSGDEATGSRSDRRDFGGYGETKS